MRFFPPISKIVSRKVFIRKMASITYETISRMVAVKSIEGEEKLKLIMDDCWGHHHEFLRDKGEHVSKALKRIVLTSIKSQSGNRKRKRTEVEEKTMVPTSSIKAVLYAPTGDIVEDKVPNIDAWVEGSVLEMGGIRYKVQVNIPSVLSLKLSRYVMSGGPVVPEVTLTPQLSSHLCMMSVFSFRWIWSLQIFSLVNGSGFVIPSLSQRTTPMPFRYWVHPLLIGLLMKIVATDSSSSAHRLPPMDVQAQPNPPSL